MKTTFYLMIFLCISTFIFSCGSDDDFEYQTDFEQSRNVWESFKVASNNSYKYVVPGGSVFFNYGWETTITVSSGIIIQRDFTYIGVTENIPDEQLSWTENKDEINSHESTSAAYALTLDEIYYKAENEWLLDRKNATTYFEAKNNGLISTCGYVENGCMDDCFMGIIIKSIESL